MTAAMEDYSVLDRFKFARKPVGVKYTIERPKNLVPLKKELNFCEMIKEAQEHGAFYVAPDNWHCIEYFILGFDDPDPVYVSGLFGGDEGLFKDQRACRQMYYGLPKMLKGSVQYVTFTPADELTSDPDVLVITADMHQAPTVLRAVNYSTGETMTSKTTPVMACSWLMVYPVISGEVNYIVTGLGLGMQALNIFPAGLFLISIPYQKLPIALANLAAIPYREPEPGKEYRGPGGDAHRARVKELLKGLKERIKRPANA